MKTDIEIAQEAQMLPIEQVAEGIGLAAQSVSPYGRYKAKLDHRLLTQLAQQPDGKVILVTAISPTPAGEGKTTTSVGLADALHRLNRRVMLCLREPSLGPVFGVKGGAAGGGYAQVVPMEDINLHFTGDLHAIGAANNLLAAMVDNHIFQGNRLGIDPRRVTWHRCVDMNDRQLRDLVDGLGGKTNGTPREDAFDITVASEVMAVFCLASDLADLKERLGRIVVGWTYAGEPVTAAQLGAAGAMTALLKDAFDPNLVQTLEHTPALIHGGPFANIAHGCNSVVATRLSRKLADYVVTEAGFGADLGAEKFLDIKCRLSGIRPSAVVVVATFGRSNTTAAAPIRHSASPVLILCVPGCQTLPATLKICKTLACRSSSRSTPSPPIPTLSGARWRPCAAAWGCPARCLRYLPKAVPAANSWHSRCLRSSTNRPRHRLCSLPMPTSCRLPKRCVPSAARCTAPTMSSFRRRRKRHWRRMNSWGMAIARFALRKHSIRSATTPSCWPRQAGLPCRCGTCGFLPGRALLWCCAAPL